jgi:hypothetical protein
MNIDGGGHEYGIVCVSYITCNLEKYPGEKVNGDGDYLRPHFEITGLFIACIAFYSA